MDGSTLYRVTPEGSVTVPYNFCSGAQYPGNDLVLFTDGRLYTTTVQGGPLRVGSIDRITPRANWVNSTLLTALMAHTLSLGSF